MPAEVVPASRKLARDEAAQLIRDASKIYVAKGKKLDEFKGGKAAAEIVDAMLGPTGNLRSPCIRSGKNVLVGFNEDLYEQVLG